MSNTPLKKVIFVAVLGLGAWFSLRYLLPPALPFLLGLCLAAAADPIVRVCTRRLKLPRAAAAGIGVSLTILLLAAVLVSMGALLVDQLRLLAARLPDMGQTVAVGLDSLQERMRFLAEKTPENLRPLARQSVDRLFASGDLIVEKVTALAGSLASGLVARIPAGALNVGTFVLASFMFSVRLPVIRRWLALRSGGVWERMRRVRARLKQSVGGWLVAQAKLIALTFGVLAAGFLLLRIDNALLWAGLICLADALPVLGTGVILVPWSIVCFIQGQHIRAVGLLGVCAVAVLLRSILEPKLVGKQLGLDPLITLAAIYVGYRLWGLPGMLTAPLLAVTAMQLLLGEI